MKVLLDENLPHRLRRLLGPMHQGFTVTYMGWNGLANGELLRAASAAGFDVLLTTDRGLEYEQNQASLPCSVVILHVASNAFNDLQPLVPEIQIALDSLPPRTLLKIGPASR